MAPTTRSKAKATGKIAKKTSAGPAKSMIWATSSTTTGKKVVKQKKQFNVSEKKAEADRFYKQLKALSDEFRGSQLAQPSKVGEGRKRVLDGLTKALAGLRGLRKDPYWEKQEPRGVWAYPPGTNWEDSVDY